MASSNTLNNMLPRKLVVWCVICVLSVTSGVNLDAIFGLQTYRTLRLQLLNGIGRNSGNAKDLEKARLKNMLQEPVPQYIPFPCPVEGFRSEKPPMSVANLRPGDIDIVGALGDSLTAGNGLVATNVLQVYVENRGLSWSIGGQGSWREYLTLPNILKEFNPNLIGYSLKDSFTTERDSQFNVAEIGAISREMIYMSKILVKRIKADSRVNIKQHWKLITIMIGPNDFCLEICHESYPERSLEAHRTDVISVLRYLRDNLPRTIVNLVPSPHLKQLKEVTDINKPNYCHTTNHLECSCLFGFQYQNQIQRFYKLIEEWQKIDKEVAEMKEFHLQDFTVIYQPFTLGMVIPRNEQNLTDYSNLSYDCFHLSQKFNAEVANALWNNMLEPLGRKSTTGYPLFQKFLCPLENSPYIFTQYNSF